MAALSRCTPLRIRGPESLAAGLRRGYSWTMNALFRARIEKRLLREAAAICEEMGLNTQEAVRLFLVALVRRRELPFKITAESPEDELLQPLTRRAEILESFYETR